ncbi:unnamed protein product [Parnassius apollo]|uniref:(apollo) hypothetical protein n=1 Tax=Parnassius apollo TaxID=110799 RepID=A0A8S3WJ56_PARAO|nr:unnamed protein product [Parnassius apollo]
MPLNCELVLDLFNNGKCSDIDIDEADEDFCPQPDATEYDAHEKESPPSPDSKKSYSSLVRKEHEGDGPSKTNKQKKSRKFKKKPKQNTQLKVKFGQRRRIWKKSDYIDKPHNYPGHPKPDKVQSPVEYFGAYYDEDFFENMALCTNLYYMRHTGKVLNTNKQEIKRLYGIHLLMGIHSYPRYAIYWRRNISINIITSAMTRDRFSLL